MKKFNLHLDDTLGEALMQAARKELRYPDQQIEVILRRELGIPVPPLEDTKPEPIPAGAPHD